MFELQATVLHEMSGAACCLPTKIQDLSTRHVKMACPIPGNHTSLLWMNTRMFRQLAGDRSDQKYMESAIEKCKAAKTLTSSSQKCEAASDYSFAYGKKGNHREKLVLAWPVLSCGAQCRRGSHLLLAPTPPLCPRQAFNRLVSIIPIMHCHC